MSEGSPMDEGRLAAAQGEKENTNPYPDGSDEHEEWKEGFAHQKDTDEDGELLE